ncbi:uncharacterized protein LOC142348295 [Convolutriloba macropyga]|uniref:uncharacterized protein LOC142348295 n=1 Tax=Convolutriloba macropyga TaxID=536237 RepID=UPI003F525954
MATRDIEQEMVDKLVVVPKPPVELHLLNPSIDSILGNSKAVQSLINANVCGLLIRNQVHESIVSQTDTNSNQISDEKMSQGCVFFPSTFDRVIVVKYVSKLSNDESVNYVLRSIEHQLDDLSNVVRQVNGNLDIAAGQSLPVQMIICLPSKVKKSGNFTKFQTSFVVMMEDESKFPNIKQSGVAIDEKTLKKEITTSLKTVCSQKSDIFSKLISFYDQKLNKEQLYELSSENCKFMNNQFSRIGEVDDIIQLYNFYFPNRMSELESIPHFNQITDNMLYNYTDEGDPGKLPDYASYMGEVRLFSELLLSKLENPSGILIKAFSNVHLKTLMSPDGLQPQNFEIDWLYLGNGKIVVFEVGMSENPEEPKRPIQNKISQCITKIIPQMQLILYSFWAPYQQKIDSERKNFDQFLEDNLRVIIFLPEVGYRAFAREIESIGATLNNYSHLSKKQRADDFIIDLQRNRLQVTKWLTFLVGGDKACDELKLFRITDDFNVAESLHSIDEVFQNSSSLEDSLSTYACSLFSVAGLNVVQLENGHVDKNALDVDQRYLPFFARWFNKKVNIKNEPDLTDTDKKANFNLVLSPQQHRILSDSSKSHLIVSGQPGSGKTTLILAKCEQMAELDSVEEIFFLYDKDKRLFRNYLDRLIKSNCSQIMNRKMTIQAMDPDNDDLAPFLNRIENVVNFRTIIIVGVKIYTKEL